MINRANIDRLEDAIDEFEQTWSETSQTRIEQLLESYGLVEDHEAIAELIRIDIELRYERGASIELEDYLNRFQILCERPGCVADIAFEDYRSRSANGYTVSAERWRNLPGVPQASWFRDLSQNTSRHRNRNRLQQVVTSPIEDAAFRMKLFEHGFQLVQQIASGTFSRVYLANQSELADRFVVLKVVDKALAEPERMALLQHTNIVPIYSFHRIGSRSVICMPYAGCVTLNDFLRGKTEISGRGGQSLMTTVKTRIDDTQIALDDRTGSDVGLGARRHERPAANEEAVLRPMEEFRSLDCSELAVWIFVRLSGALAHAHARGVLHNDLKPSNVLIRNDGEPALLDFNLAQSLGNTVPRHAGGTLPYMAPEVYRAMMGQRVQPHAASDLYAMGVMLFEFLTGRLPYPTPASPAAVDLDPAIEARRAPVDWRDCGATVSPGLRAIIEKCLQFEPQSRYAGADQLRTDLQQEQRQMPLVTAKEAVGWRVRKWVRRHPRLISSAAIATVLLGILIPTGYQAVRWHHDNRVLNAQATYRTFLHESTDFLSRLMADPRRQAKANIGAGMSLLKRYGLTDQATLDRVLAAYGETERDAVRAAVRRHAAHLAILESDRLQRIRQLASRDGRTIDAEKLATLDELIRVSHSLAPPAHLHPSRSQFLLLADRARLGGNEERYQLLRKFAQETPAQEDAELYLEAVRLLSEFKYVAAGEVLTALADRKSIPPALRWTLLGRAQFAEKKFEDAKLSFTQSIERAPSSAALYVMRGRCYLELNHGDKAIQDFRMAIALEPKNRSAWSHLGIVHSARKEYGDAVQCFDRAIETSPSHIWTLLKRSKAHQMLGDKQKSDADYDAAMDAETNDPNDLLVRALARVDDKPEAALEDLEQARRLHPDRPAILMEMARTLAVELKSYQRAAEIYSQVLQIQPLNEHARVDRALSLVRMGHVDEALRETRMAMEEPNLPRNLYQAACVHALIDREPNRQRAVALIAKAIQSGYRPPNLAGDPDLASLADNSGFRAVVRFYEMAEQAFQDRRRRRGRATSMPDDISVYGTTEFTSSRISAL